MRLLLAAVGEASDAETPNGRFLFLFVWEDDAAASSACRCFCFATDHMNGGNLSDKLW